jgi:hypothetical protein
VSGQLLAAYEALEQEVSRVPLQTPSGAINQAGITAAVAWYFTQATLPEIVVSSRFPMLERFSAASEQLPEFRAAPHGAGTYPHAD